MSDIHPSYATADKQLGDALANTTELSDEELAEALRILSAQLSTQQSTQEIHAEIDRLADQALSLDATFDRVVVLLKQIGAESSKPGMREEVEAMARTWAAHRANYTSFLWKSRTVAGKAEAAATDFASDFVEFLKDPDVTIPEKKDEIKNYLIKLDKDAASSKEVQQGFIDLQSNIKVFSKKWQALVDKYKADTDPPEWTQLDKDIRQLNITLWTLRLKIDRLAKSMGVIVATNGVSSIFAAICPAFWTQAMTTALQAKKGRSANAVPDTTRDVQGLQKEIDQKSARRDAVAKNLSGPNAVGAHLSAGDSGLGDFCARLAAIGSVWDTIRVDLKTISDLLDHTKGDLPKQLFELRLDTIASLYNILAEALHHYQTAVDPGHEVFSKIRGEL